MTAPPRGAALVIGGHGFLGRHVADGLVDAGYEVVRTTRGRHPGPGDVTVDLVSSAAADLRTAVAAAAPVVVVNCSGAVSGTPGQLADGNVVAPARLVAAVAATAPQARVVHLGSAAEYGAAGGDRAVSEDDEPEPLGPYGVSKLAGTRILLALAADHGITATVLRIFNPVGAHAPGSTLPGRLAGLLRSTAPDGELSVGPLGAERDFVDVRDVAAAVVAAATVGAPGPLYNIGSGRATVSRELAHGLSAIAGFGGRILEAAPPSDRSAGLARQQADIARAARELAWKPRYGLDESLLDLWRCAT